jgi:phage terminase large subunit
MREAAPAPPADSPPADPTSYFRPNSLVQAMFMRSEAPEVLISSAYGKGKSRVLCEKAHWLCLVYPGARVVLARKQRAHIGGTTLRTLLDEVVHPEYIAKGWAPGADGGSTLFYPNKSELIVVGLDNPGRARSGAYTAAYVDQCEELDEEEWEAIGGRLRHKVGPYRQLGGACNPDSPDHFLFRRFRPDRGTHRIWHRLDRVRPDGSLEYTHHLHGECIVSGQADNYDNLPDDYKMRLARMSGRYRMRYVDGLWVAYEGQVYDNWNPLVHNPKKPDAWRRWGWFPPPSWRRYRAIDFGYVNPFVCQWWARDPSGAWWLYREIYMSHRTVNEHAAQMRLLEQREVDTINSCLDAHVEACRRNGTEPELTEPWPRLPVSLSVSDHDAEDRATLDAAGFPTYPAVKDVTSGVQTVYNLLAAERLFIVQKATVESDPYLEAERLIMGTADEMPAYRYPKLVKPASEKAPKEEPRKASDHGLDAVRYLLHTVAAHGEMQVATLFEPVPKRRSRDLLDDEDD